jgi:hypothetical protein
MIYASFQSGCQVLSNDSTQTSTLQAVTQLVGLRKSTMCINVERTLDRRGLINMFYLTCTGLTSVIEFCTFNPSTTYFKLYAAFPRFAQPMWSLMTVSLTNFGQQR